MKRKKPRPKYTGSILRKDTQKRKGKKERKIDRNQAIDNLPPENPGNPSLTHCQKISATQTKDITAEI